MIHRVTMAEIARRAHVHVSTVSMALRNHPEISQATRNRIQRLAEEMGFRPDPALSALIAYRRTAQAQSHPHPAPIAYITNWHSRWGWQEMPAHARFYAGARARADQLGFALEHFWLGEPGLTHRRMNEILVSRGIKALIFASHRPQADEELRFNWPEFAAVKIDFAPHQPHLSRVSNDQRGIMQEVFRRIRAAGYRRPGLVMPASWDRFVDLAWSAGFLAEQQQLPDDAQLPVLGFVEGPTAETQRTGPDRIVPRQLLARWLDEHQPDVLISYRPFIASRLEETGYSVPDDLAFVDMCLYEADGTTAGVRHNCERVGEIAVESVTTQLQHNALGLPQFPATTLVEGTWCEGASLPSRTATVSESAGAEIALAAH